MVKFGMILLLLLSACSPPEAAQRAESQQWGEFEINLETRPAVMRVGMNEFILIINRERKRYIQNMLVKIRTSGSEWRQAMPDGALGIYRRALPVHDIEKDKLYVYIRYEGEETELIFDLAPAR